MKLWLFLEADRWLVTALLVALTFAGLVAGGLLVPAAERAISSGDSVDTLFQALLTAVTARPNTYFVSSSTNSNGWAAT